MIAYTVAELASIVGAEIFDLDPLDIITEYPEIDSRKLYQEHFLLQLPGERVDGNSYAREAIDNGARFALASLDLGIPSLVVNDTSVALMKLASDARERMANCILLELRGHMAKPRRKISWDIFFRSSARPWCR
ncbi:MAG: hypothetical protein WDN07_04110 [Actinomycetota bacterium]